MQDTADLINALAALIQAIAWPAVAILLVLLLRGEFPNLAARVRRVLFRRGDTEVEIDLDTGLQLADRLDQRSEEFEREVHRELPPPDGRIEVPHIPATTRVWPPTIQADDSAYDPRRSIQESTDPRLIVIELDREIEREARAILASFSGEANWRRVPTMHMLRRLELPETIVAAAGEFKGIRNAIVHSGGASIDDAIRAVDVGIRVLDALRRTARNVHIVRASGIPLFRDETATQSQGITGVKLDAHPLRARRLARGRADQPGQHRPFARDPRRQRFPLRSR